ncbi:Conserved oligomeric Golgi complex subunit 2 [Modicella reniformis]|uniref:Conserved oligomeric Golgi complex subunit 2 n=1 Tax=Modicella reniformis TaxID=1440133 RepID=A0A9P6INU5_9FUNG|nr:Conserved oligomeric Golgi complex subunit 2 [Modicella reniformis]
MTSEMLRRMYRARPPPLPPHFDDDDYDDEHDNGDIRISESLDELGALSFQSCAPAVHPSTLSRPSTLNTSNRYSPLDWKDFFEEKRFVTVPGEDETEADITFNVFEIRGKPGAPLFVMHHGAGLAALSFALTAKEIKEAVGQEASILTFDCRGHGETTSGHENNLSLDRLAKDLKNVLNAIYGEHLPEIILVGHSMGGAVVSEAASRGMIPNLIGVAVLDIVEGVAIETLANMNGWLERRPNAFRSLDKVVQWGMKSGTVRNLKSARVSCPPLVVLSQDSTAENPCYVWRTDLAASEQYWKEWFTGLTEKFLSAKAGKLLILAGTDRLDKDMTIAQMQGRFQMLVFPNSGHAVQEDEPDRMARELVAFWKRNQRLVLPPRPFLPGSFLAHPPHVHVQEMVASSRSTDNFRNGVNGDGTTNTHNRRPSHLSIDSNSANSAFLHTLNSQLRIAANNQSNRRQNSQQGDAAVSENDFPLSIGVDRAALIAPDFNTDEFLSARRHLPLEELKSQELKTELIELINSDYTDFINLSTNLNGVDRMMEDLRKPLDRMKSDAMVVSSNLQTVIGSLEQKLQHRAETREKKASLQLLLNISESVSKVEGLLQISSTTEAPTAHGDGNESISAAKRLERVAIEYNQMQYLVNKGAGLPFVTNIDWRLVRIKETMSENLSTVLRGCILSPQQAGSDASSNKDVLSQCLRTYALIDQTVEAEKIIAEDLLAPFISKTITRSALSDQSHIHNTNSERVSQSPLATIYNHVLQFIDDRCGSLISVTQKELKGTNFDIPVNCIWGMSTQTILKNIPQILTPGIPDDFHRNYMDTMSFVSKIEELCGSRKSLARLRSQAGYQAFMKRWQLPAYFQLRFRDISLLVEDALQSSVDVSQRSPSNDVHLPASLAIIRAIERCWSPDVFIYGIAYNFWKFTLQLMTRYSIWVSTNLTKDLDPSKDKSAQSRSSSPAGLSSSSSSRQQGRSTPASGLGPLRPSGPGGRTSFEESMLQQLSMVVHDIDHVVVRIQEIFDQQIRPKLPSSIADEPTFLESVKNLAARASEGPPHEPSGYVAQILAPLSRYLSGSGSVLRSESRDAWALVVITTTTNQYSEILDERLMDTKLSEERTNKLKAAAAKTRAGGPLSRVPMLPNVFSSAAPSDAEVNMSTNDKFRLQCVLDVKFYKSELTKFNIEPDTFQPFLDLESKTQPYEHLLSAAGQT